MSYTVGQPVKIQTVVNNDLGVPTNATVSLTVTKPDSTTIIPSITNPLTGHYETTVVPNLPGTWLYVWSVTGAVTGVDDGQFEVAPVTIRINSLADLRAHLNKQLANTSDDSELEDIADAAQVMIEREIGDVVPKAYSEYHNGGSHRIVVWNGPIVSVTSIVEHLNGAVLKVLTNSEYRVDGLASTVTRIMGVGYPSLFQGGYQDVLITYVAGRTQPIPANIRLAHKELTAHLWRNTQIGRTRRVRGAVPEDDLSQASPGYSMPNRIREMIGVKKPMVF
jgi:uncharacterized phiE125 gp8 family phage protein